MDKSRKKQILENILYPIISLAIMLIIWVIVARVENNPLVFPSPKEVIKRFFVLGSEGNFWKSVGFTILRTLECFTISFLISLIFAIFSSFCTPIYKILSPMVTFFRAVPTVAVILILYAFLDNESLCIVVGFLIAFPLMYQAFYTGISNIDKGLFDMAKIYMIPKSRQITSIYIPSIAPVLFDTSRSTLSLTLKVIIASEILANVSKSIGGKIQTAYATFEVEYLLAWTLIAIVFSFVLEGIVAIFKKIWEALR